MWNIISSSIFQEIKMPLYRYRCTDCEIDFERIMSIKEKCDKETPVFCPDCGCFEVVPLLSKTSFSLKGDGRYKDGYQKKDS